VAREIGEQVPDEVLNAFGLAGATTCLFADGNVNLNWRVDADHRTVVVRRCGVPRGLASIAWEQQLMTFAGAKGWPVPLAEPAAAGGHAIEYNGGWWTCHQFLPGEAQSMDTPAARHIQGRLLGRLHKDLGSFDGGGQRPGFGKTWELDVIVEPAGAGTFNALLAAFGREYPDLAGSIRRQRYRNLRELARLHYPDLADHPIHGDVSPRNLLFEGGQLTGLLDFDFARQDAWLCDIAPLLMPFQPLEPRLAASLLDGYQSVRQLTEAEWGLLPSLVRASLLWWVALLLVKWRLTGGPPAGIDRTMKQRFPAFDAFEPEVRALAQRAMA
jgi:homoserine kinase type II